MRARPGRSPRPPGHGAQPALSPARRLRAAAPRARRIAGSDTPAVTECRRAHRRPPSAAPLSGVSRSDSSRSAASASGTTEADSPGPRRASGVVEPGAGAGSPPPIGHRVGPGSPPPSPIAPVRQVCRRLTPAPAPLTFGNIGVYDSALFAELPRLTEAQIAAPVPAMDRRRPRLRRTIRRALGERRHPRRPRPARRGAGRPGLTPPARRTDSRRAHPTRKRTMTQCRSRRQSAARLLGPAALRRHPTPST